jgi:uncharacterized protein YndB with AHSA1/START domain
MPLPFQRIVRSVAIAAPPELVFDFLTNAAQWQRWQPATRAVRGAPDRPLTAGETIIEHVRAPHRSVEVTWTVTACEPPRLWRIETATPPRASVVTYVFEPLGTGCRLQRICDFRSEGLWRLLDGNITRWTLSRQAARALVKLHDLFL